MSAWRIRGVKRKSASTKGKSVDTSDSPVVGWKPTRARAIRILEAAKGDRSRWGAETLFGLFVQQYEKRYCRKWTANEEYGWDVVDKLRSLKERRGAEEAARAIEVVFGLRWVTADHLGFLLRDGTYERFIVPALDTSIKKGEQSEWSKKEGSGFWDK